MTVSLTLAVADFSHGNDLPRARPRQLNVSARTLGQGLQLFRSAIEKDELRNVELMVLRDGHIILHEALGWQNKEADLPLPRNTLFRMASNTKAAIATGVLQLVESGEVALDDPIGKHLPALGEASAFQLGGGLAEFVQGPLLDVFPADHRLCHDLERCLALGFLGQQGL